MTFLQNFPIKKHIFRVFTFYVSALIELPQVTLYSTGCFFQIAELYLLIKIFIVIIYDDVIYRLKADSIGNLLKIKTYFWPKLECTKDNRKYYFKQDGATPHTANTVQEWLCDHFSTKFIDKKKWPPPITRFEPM